MAALDGCISRESLGDAWQGRFRCAALQQPPPALSSPLPAQAQFVLELLCAITLRLQLRCTPLSARPSPSYLPLPSPPLLPSSPYLHLLTVMPLHLLPAQRRSFPCLELTTAPASSSTTLPSDPPPLPLSLLLSALLRPAHCLLLSSTSGEETADDGSSPFGSTLYFVCYLDGSAAVMEPLLSVDAAVPSQRAGESCAAEWSQPHTPVQAERETERAAEEEEAAHDNPVKRRERKRRREQLRSALLRPLIALCQRETEGAEATTNPHGLTTSPAQPQPPPSLPSATLPAPPPPAPPPPHCPRLSRSSSAAVMSLSSPSSADAWNASSAADVFDAAAARLRRPLSAEAALLLRLSVVTVVRKEVGEERWTQQRLSRADLRSRIRPVASALIRSFWQQQMASSSRTQSRSASHSHTAHTKANDTQMASG